MLENKKTTVIIISILFGLSVFIVALLFDIPKIYFNNQSSKTKLLDSDEETKNVLPNNNKTYTPTTSDQIPSTSATDISGTPESVAPVMVKNIYIDNKEQKDFLNYDKNSAEIIAGQLRCKKDDRILQWSSGDKEWDCVEPPEAVFGSIAQSVKITSTGVMECNNNGEVIYWDEDDDHWDCGSIGNGLDIAMNDLTDADTVTTLPLNNQILGWDGTNWVPMDATVSSDDNQTIDTFSLVGDALTLEIENDGIPPQIVDLSQFITNAESINELADVDVTTPPTNGQVLTWDSINSQWIASSISAGNTDNQQLGLNNLTNIVTLSNGTGADTTIDLTPYLDNTDNQDLTLVGNTLAISNDPNTDVDLSGYLDNTDNQIADVFNLQGNDLHLSLEDDGVIDNIVDLSGYLDNTDSQTLSLLGTNLTISGGNTQDLASIIDWNNLLNIPADIADGDDDTTYSSGSGLSLVGTTFSINSPTCAGTDKLQWNGTAFVCSADVDTDTQDLSIVGHTISLVDGGSVVVPDNDTTYTAGTGLNLTGTTFNLNSSIDNLIDVDTSTTPPINNQVLSWNGTNWVPTTSVSDNIYTADGTLTGNREVLMAGNDLGFTGGNIGIGTATPSFKLELAGTTSTADRKIGINGTQTVYLPDQTDFIGSLFIGNGGGSLSHSAGNEGRYNTGVGMGTLSFNTTGQQNTAIGLDALSSNTTGSLNVVNGVNGLFTNTTGSYNSALGNGSMYLNTTGEQNTAVGLNSLFANTEGGYNVAIGVSALRNNTTGEHNVGIGRNSGRYIADGSTLNETGSRSVFLGDSVRASANGVTNEIVIGDSAIGIGSDTVVLGNDSITVTALKGDVGIGTTTPLYKLDVTGTGRFTDALTIGAYTLPNTDGTNGQVLQTDGSGALTWNAVSGSGDSDWTISGSNMYSGVTGNVGIGTTTPTLFKLQLTGSIGPTTNDTYDLGSNANRWRDLFLGPGSLHIGTNTSDEGSISYNTAINRLDINVNGTSRMYANTTGVTIPTLASTIANNTTTRAGNGSIGTPSYSFASDPDNGMYYISANSYGFGAASANKMTINTAGVTIPTLSTTTLTTAYLRPGNGAVGLPSHSFASDTNNGMYYISTDRYGFSAGGTNRITINTAGVTIPTLSTTTFSVPNLRLPNGSIGAPTYSFASDTNNGMYYISTDRYGFSAGGTNRMTVNTTGVTIPALSSTTLTISQIRPGNGSAGLPSHSFATDTNTGMYRLGVDSLGFATTGVNRMTIGNTGIVTIPTLSTTTLTTSYLRPGNGTAGLPSHSFASDTNNGMYYISTDRYGFSAGGTNRMTINTAGVTIPALSTTTLTTAYLRPGNGTAGAPSHSFATDTNTGMYRLGVGSLGFATTGVNRMTIGNTGIVTIPTLSATTFNYTGAFNIGYGSATVPSYSFSGDTNTGMYHLTTDQIGLATGGTNRMTINNTGVTIPTLSTTTFNYTGAFNIGYGSATIPSYSFSGDTNTGMYHLTTDQIGLATGGTNRMTINNTGVTIPTLSTTTFNYTGAFNIGYGSATVPSYSFSGDTNTGMYHLTTDQIGLATGGTNRMTINNTGVTIPTLSTTTFNYIGAFNIGYGSTSIPTYSFNGDTDTGMYHPSANQIGFATGGTNRMTINNAGVTIPTLSATTATTTTANITNMRASTGSVALPSISFNIDTDNGIYRVGPNSYGFSAGGTNRMTINTAGVTIPTLSATTATTTTANITNMRASTGSVALPSISFNIDTDNGIYRVGPNSYGFSAGGTNRMTINTAGVTIPAGSITSVTNHFIPSTTNTYNLGSNTVLWDTVYATNGVSTTSDINFKNDIAELDYGLDAVLSINPISFTWKDTRLDNNIKIGFSAQELQAIIPEVVNKSDGGQLGVYYSDLIPVAFNAIKEQNITITSNKEQTTDLYGQVSNLSLQTDTNITNLTELQTSIDKNLTIINQTLTSLAGSQTTNIELAETVDNNTDNITTNIEDLNTLATNINALTELATTLTDTLTDHEARILILEDAITKLQGINNNQIPINNDLSSPEIPILDLTDILQTFSDSLTLIQEDSDNPQQIFSLSGDLIVERLKAKKIEAEEIEVAGINTKKITAEKLIIDNEDTIGTAKIKAGETKVTVKTNIVNENSHIMLTPHETIIVGLGNVKNGEEFVIKIAEEFKDDLEIEWFIINGKK